MRNCAWLLLLCAPWVYAQILDDSASPKQQFNITLEWQNNGNLFSLSERELNQLIARVPNAQVRLDTRDFVGQAARIFLRLPEQIKGLGNSAGLKLEWRTRGNFQAGHTTPGNRALIFEGQVSDPLLIEFFTFTMNLDARSVTGALRFEPIYEIELM